MWAKFFEAHAQWNMYFTKNMALLQGKNAMPDFYYKICNFRARKTMPARAFF